MIKGIDQAVPLAVDDWELIQNKLIGIKNNYLPDIKAADNLIETEIAKVKEDLASLEEETLTIEDGYVKASLKGEVDGLPENAELKVDAVEFNQAGKNDILTVFVEDKPFRVEKYKINISEEDNL